MTITADWQAELAGSFLMGAPTVFRFSKDRLGGFGVPAPRTRDLDRGDYPGSVAGRDLTARRLIPLPFEIVGATQSAALASLADLKAAWAARESDTTLDVRLPGQSSTTYRYYGRPRGVTVDLQRIAGGWVKALALFDALDPFGYGAAETTGVDSSSPASVTNNGDVPTDRFTITVVGNGGTPVITNTSDDNQAVSFLAGFSGTAVLDFRTHTITVSLVDSYALLAPGPRWFRLVAGANTITFTGCASIQVDWQPAYL